MKRFMVPLFFLEAGSEVARTPWRPPTPDRIGLHRRILPTLLGELARRLGHTNSLAKPSPTEPRGRSMSASEASNRFVLRSLARYRNECGDDSLAASLNIRFHCVLFDC